MVLNVLDPSLTRYIEISEELEQFLKEKYGADHPGFDFEVEHICDRWAFEAPEKVTDDEIKRFIDDLERRKKQVK